MDKLPSQRWKWFLMRHLRSETSDWKETESFVNGADPSVIVTQQGFVRFLYDPFLPLDEDRQPEMGTVWAVKITDAMGVTSIRLTSPDWAEIRCDVYDDNSESEFDNVDWLIIDKLLDGKFSVNEPPADWLELEADLA